MWHKTNGVTFVCYACDAINYVHIKDGLSSNSMNSTRIQQGSQWALCRAIAPSGRHARFRTMGG